MNLKIVLTGRSYDQSSELPNELKLPETATLNDVISEINKRLGTDLPTSCLVAVAGNHVGTVSQHSDCDLADGQEVVFLQPVAGG